MDFALNSIIGKRENQEDYGVIKTDPSTDGLLAVISDGMGGQVAGEIASLTTVSCFVESFTADGSKNLPLRLRVALEKAKIAYQIAKCPILVDDEGLYLEQYNNFPGPLTKYVFHLVLA